MFTRILVPTDFSEPSDAALHYAKGIAARYGASLQLVHVIDDPIVTGIFAVEGYVPDASNVAAVLTKAAEMRLAALMPSLEGESFPTGSAVLHGPAASTICAKASDIGADLIVMGTHGRTGLTHVLLGSVAERVVRNAPCPVLTVHAKPGVARVRPELDYFNGLTRLNFSIR